MYSYKIRIFLCSAIGIIIIGCSAFYYKLKSFNKCFENYDFPGAQKNLEKSLRSKKDRFLYLVNSGIVCHMMREYDKSNGFFEEAFKLTQTSNSNIVSDISKAVLNTEGNYIPEEHEKLYVYYYKILNYIHLNNFNEALHECRRLDLALRLLKTKYHGNKNYFTRDAYLYTIMGIVYQAVKEYDKAFYCYRNAVDAYKKEYSPLFNIKIPKQLKLDTLNAALKAGFYSKFEYFEKHFDIKFDSSKYDKYCDAIFLWHNGFAPFKDSMNIIFVANPAVGGIIHFKNTELGLNFAFPIPPTTNKASLSDTMMFKISFPKYVEKVSLYHGAHIEYDNKKFPLELANDINKISFKILRQRMIWELSKTLISLFLKKTGEHLLKKHVHTAAGIAYGIFNLITEKSDTRCWYTLPHSIYYRRMKVAEGDNKMNFVFYNKEKSIYKTRALNIVAKKGITKFYIFNSLT